MPFQTHISFPSFSLTSKALRESVFKKLKMTKFGSNKAKHIHIKKQLSRPRGLKL